ncbi:MAG: 6-bladed beta-propeller [Candidatus Aminicenantes bacterium]|nr:6-bladed beta-propeller [Candidatus Aminicenantes bacterium]
MKRIMLALSFFAAATAAFLSGREPQTAWKGTIVQDGGVLIVQNPKTPIYPGEILTLKEELSIGGGAADPNKTFSDGGGLDVDDAGRIYLTDLNECCVRVFDPDGKLIRTFGRMGQGPGEFRQPFYVSVCPATREVLVTDFMFGMHLFDMDGRFIRKIGTERPFMARLDSRGRVVYLHSTVDDKGNAEFETRRAGLNAESSRQIAVEVRRALDLFAPIPYWDLGSHDRIAYGYPTDYEIRIYDGENKLVRKVRREYDRVETTKEQKSALDKSASLIGAPVKLALPKYQDPFSRFNYDDRGWLIVRVPNPKAGDKRVCLDVFDEEGRYLTQVKLEKAPILWKKGKAYVFAEDADGYDVLKRYGVTWDMK